MSSEHLYLAHRASIEQTISSVCRRQRLSAVDAEDFAGAVRLHVIQNDYAVLRKFEHRSSLKTYLITVVSHFYRDWRNARWGKWRPSAEARRQGVLGVHLERLIARDGLTFDEAYETLRTNFQVEESKATLAQMADRFPARQARQFVSEETLEEYPAAARTDELVREREARDAAAAAVGALDAAVARLAAQDRLILRLRFDDGLPVVAIARALKLDQKPLYRRIERLLGQLRRALLASGITAEAAAELLSGDGFVPGPAGPGTLVEFRPRVRPYTEGDGSTVQNSRPT